VSMQVTVAIVCPYCGMNHGTKEVSINSELGRGLVLHKCTKTTLTTLTGTQMVGCGKEFLLEVRLKTVVRPLAIEEFQKNGA
jgi:hypothetical protein